MNIKFVLFILSIKTFSKVFGVCISNQTNEPSVTDPIVGAWTGEVKGFTFYYSLISTVYTQKKFNGTFFDVITDFYWFNELAFECVNFPQNFLKKANSVNTYNKVVFGFSELNCQGRGLCLGPSKSDCGDEYFNSPHGYFYYGNSVNYDVSVNGLQSFMIRKDASVKFYSNKYWSGEEYFFRKAGCINFPEKLEGKVYSIDTHDYCVRLYEGLDCTIDKNSPTANWIKTMCFSPNGNMECYNFNHHDIIGLVGADQRFKSINLC